MAELHPGEQDAVAPETLGALGAAYPGLGGHARIARNSLSVNSASCLFETAAGRFFAKGILPSRKSLPWLLEEHRVIRHLVGGGYPTPRVLVNDGGSTVTQLAGRLWSVYACADGEDRYSGSSVFDPFGTDAEAESAGRALARLHRALEDLADLRRRPFIGPVAQYELAWAKDLRRALQDLLAGQAGAWDYLADRPDLDEALALFDALRQTVLDRAPGGKGLPHGAIHGDWIKRNLFFAGQDVAAVVDFDLCNRAPLAFDLALAMSAAGYSWPPLQRGAAPHAGQADRLRTGYEAVRPLARAEAQALPGLVATCRFEFHVSLVADWLARGSSDQATWFWEGQVASLRWWYNRGLHA